MVNSAGFSTSMPTALAGYSSASQNLNSAVAAVSQSTAEGELPDAAVLMQIAQSQMQVKLQAKVLATFSDMTDALLTIPRQ